MKVIMILGAGMMQLPAYRAARKNGWTSIAADGNPDAPCRKLADHFIAVDLKDRFGLTEEAARFKEETGLDGVFTCGTDFSTSVAWIARQLELPGISYQTALNCTDKIRMRTVFRENGIPSPEFVEISEDMDPEAVCSAMSYPLVVKPVDNMGGRGVLTVDKPENLSAAVTEAIRFSRTDRAIVEEFMDGAEYSLDSLVYKGKLHLTGFADRHIFFPPCFIEMGHTLPAEIDEVKKSEILSVFEKAVNALGIDNGAAKGDIKYTSRGVKIGEIAARLSGGYMSGWTYPYATDVNLVEKGMRIALGLDPGDLTETEGRTSSERAFISLPGKISEIRNLEEAHETEGVRDLFLRVEEGDRVIFPVNNVSKCGNVIALGESREKALEASEKAVGKIRILLEEGDSETREFLECPLSHNFPPSAYDTENSGWCRSGGLDDFHPDFSLQYANHPVPLPEPEDDLLSKKDWHGITVKDALREIEEDMGIETDSDCEWTLFSRHLWYALLRGGIQGARWFLAGNEST